MKRIQFCASVLSNGHVGLRIHKADTEPRYTLLQTAAAAADSLTRSLNVVCVKDRSRLNVKGWIEDGDADKQWRSRTETNWRGWAERSFGHGFD